MTPTLVKTLAFAWCRIASIRKEDGVVEVRHPFGGGGAVDVDVEEEVGGPQDSERTIPLSSRRCGRSTFDLSKSADWMEYIECTEGRLNDVGGAGAYDTMRCDILLGLESPQQSSSCCIWGEAFHLNRLRHSYLSLKHTIDNNHKQTTKNNNNSNADEKTGTTEKDASPTSIATTTTTTSSTTAMLFDQALDVALLESKAILQQLLTQAVSSIPNENGQELSLSTTSENYFFLVRATILWSSSSHEAKDGHNQGIVVRGHACCNGKPIRRYEPPTPIVATIAAYWKKENNTINDSSSSSSSTRIEASIDESLPTRLMNPNTKIASWCRLRQKMEHPETFQPQGVAEVLMVRRRVIPHPHGNADDHNGDADDVPRRMIRKEEKFATSDSSVLELLEGLSSNVFVVYNDGTLRTAVDGVLHGYVRHLVLQSAPLCGIVVDPRPICLHQAPDGWKEVFITSSSRLIIPVSKILMPTMKKNKINHRLQEEEVTVSNETTVGQVEPSSSLSGFVEFWRDPVLLPNKKEEEETHHRLPDGALGPTPKWQELLSMILQEEYNNIPKENRLPDMVSLL
jgi:hypothetical protein